MSSPRRWMLLRQDPALALFLAQAFGVSPLVGQLLVNRGFDSAERARPFLRDGLAALDDPYLAGDMEKAVERVIRALDRREPIAVYGDYDVDGITATALLVRFLRSLGASVRPFIPSRTADGYGLREEAVRRLAAEGVRLIVTVDCGISSVRETACARALGVDVVVTDHHEPPPELPAAVAVVNPLLPGCSFPFKGLSGVGLSFYLAAGVRKGLRERGAFAAPNDPGGEPDLSALLDLVAVGTIADMVPLTGLNRILVRAGLERLNRAPRPGVAALLAVSGVAAGEVDASAVAFRLAPRINAAGRLGDAAVGVSLLTTDDPGEADKLAHLLDAENSRRQRIEEEIFASALALLAAGGLEERRSFVLHHPQWHPGVIGIVASRLAERFHRPALLLAGEGAELKGSARGTPSLDLYAALNSCRDLLAEFGGHRHAAGVKLAAADLAAFTGRFEDAIAGAAHEPGSAPGLALDAAVGFPDLTLAATEGLFALAPFGAANPEPVFFLGGVRASAHRVVGNGHLSFTAAGPGGALSAIAFRQGGALPLLAGPVDLAVTPEIDTWRGGRRLRLRVHGIRPAGPLEAGG